MPPKIGIQSGAPQANASQLQEQKPSPTTSAGKSRAAPAIENRRHSTSTSLPPRVSIVGFTSDVTLADGVAEGFPPPHPYRVTGHVGVTTDGGRTIFGFGPSVSKAEEEKGDVLDRLVNRETFPGKVTDDTEVFKDVHDHPVVVGSQSYTEQIVYKKDIPVTQERLGEINAKLQEHVARQELPETRYGFPFPNTCARNCATYPAELGIPLPHPRGNLSAYIPALKSQGEEWHPPE